MALRALFIYNIFLVFPSMKLIHDKLMSAVLSSITVF